MFTIKRVLGLFLATTIMSVSPMMVYADNGGGDKGHWHHGKDGQMVAKVLDLTADQEKQLKDIRKKQMDAMKSTFEQIKPIKEALNAEIIKAIPDMNKVNDLENQLKTIKGQMIDGRLNSLLAIKKVLTPEQFAGYMALEKAKKLMMHERHGKFGDMHKHWGDQEDEGDKD